MIFCLASACGVHSTTGAQKPHLQPKHKPSSSFTVLLFLIGKLFEALEVFRTRFLSNPISRIYLKQFNQTQRDAVAVLRASLGRNGLLASIRNDFAFHYHNAGHLTRFMRSWDNERLLTMYFGAPDANTLNAYAAEPFLRALMRRTKRRTPNAALRYIQRQAAAVIRAHSTFVGAVQIIALRKMFDGMPQTEEMSIRDDEYLPHDEFLIPFFAGIPSHPPRAIRAELKRQREQRTPSE